MQSPPASLLTPLDVPQKTLTGPGPSNASERVLKAASRPLLGHLHPEFTKVMDDVKAGIQYAFQTQNNLTLAISGTGHAGMEAAVTNMVEKGDVVLVATNGLWGERFADMAERHEANVKQIIIKPGHTFTLDEIEDGLKQHNPKLMFITHGESSGATHQHLEGIGELCHKYDCLLIVDSVAAMGGVPLHMDKWGIDVMYSGSQKVLSCPPGTAPISFSPKAWEKIKNRRTKVTSFYFDMNWLGNYWGCDSEARKYHHTGPISSVYCLREGLAILAEEGLEAAWKRHEACAHRLWKGLQEMGLELAVKDKKDRLPTVNAILVPEGVDWKNVAQHCMKNHQVEISGGLGSWAGKVWRVGLMGENAKPEVVDRVLLAIKDALAAA